MPFDSDGVGLRRLQQYRSLTPTVQRSGPMMLRPSSSVSSTPPPPLLSDVTLRHCDKKLLELRQQLTDSVIKDRNSPLRKHRAVRQFLQSTLQAQTQGSDPQPIPQTKVSTKKRGASVPAVTTSIPTSTALVTSPATTANNESVKNPVLPSEVLPLVLPGVTAILVKTAERRQKRAAKRRREYLKILSEGGNHLKFDADMFPEFSALSDSSGSSSEGTDTLLGVDDGGREGQGGSAAPQSMHDDGGISTPRASYMAEGGAAPTTELTVAPDSAPRVPGDPRITSAARMRSGTSTLVGGGGVLPRANKAPPCRVKTLPLTSTYEHLIRMGRFQQRHWKPQRNWTMESRNQHPADAPTVSRIGDMSPSSIVPEQDTACYDAVADADAESGSTQLVSPTTPFVPPNAFTMPTLRLKLPSRDESEALKVPIDAITLPKLNFKVAMPINSDDIASRSGADPSPTDDLTLSQGEVTAEGSFSIVRRVPNDSRGCSPVSQDGVESQDERSAVDNRVEGQPAHQRIPLRNLSAVRQGSCVRSKRCGSGWGSVASAEPVHRRRGKSAATVASEEVATPVIRRGDAELGTAVTVERNQEDDEPLPAFQRGQRRRHFSHRDSDSSSYESEEEDLEDLKRQFASFVRRRAVDDEEQDGTSHDVRPFVFPENFVKYSLSYPVGHRSGPVEGRARKRKDSLIDDTDRSTSPFSQTVKLVWGSTPADIEQSTVARTAPSRVSVELAFRPGRHQFDARHIFDLMHPYAHYVLDLEAGNRGGTFLAVYGNSELQCLKAISAMMTRIRLGMSHLFHNCYCAPSPNVPSALLVESPRDCDPLPHDPFKKCYQTEDNEHWSFEDRLPQAEGTLEDDTAQDWMAWFRKHATISQEVVNHHAPGALERYKARIDKKRKEVVRQRRKEKEKTDRQRQKKAAVAKKGLAAEKQSKAETANESDGEDQDDIGAELFIAEGDEVKGYDELKQLMDEAEKELASRTVPMAADEADPATEVDGNAAEPVESPDAAPAEPESVFSLEELREAEVVKKLEKGVVSIMELAVRSAHSPEELHKIRARKRRVSRSQMLQEERIRQLSVKSIKEYREMKALQHQNDPNAHVAKGKGGRHKSFVKGSLKFARGTSKRWFSNRKRRAEGKDSDSDKDDGESAAHATDVIAQEPNTTEASDAAVDESTVQPPAAEDGGQTAEKIKEAEARQRDLEAVEAFEEFLEQYATSEKVAVIVAMTRFEDPSIPPPPCVESDAEDLIFLLKQLDYDIIVMSPPAPLVPPLPDASEDDVAAYNEAQELERKRWFLAPTTENITEVLEALLSQNQGGRYGCVALFMLTRGYVGGFEAKTNNSTWQRSEQLIALTMESDISRLTPETCFVPRELLHRLKQKLRGKVPLLFVDTYPLPDIPLSDAYGAHAAACSKPNSTAAQLAMQQRPVAPAFLSFSAQPEDGGHELVALYPRCAGGLGTYYLKRALEGRACPPKSLIITMSNLIWYLSAKLQSKNCKVSHNAVVPKAYSSLKPYFDLNIIYDSAYEMNRNLDTAHVIEITTPVRLCVRALVRIDANLYETGSHVFLPQMETWVRQFRRELQKILYPKKNEGSVGTGGKGGAPSRGGEASKPAAPPGGGGKSMKPRPEKALRAKLLHCAPRDDSLILNYLDGPEMLFDDKRLRQVERDLSRISEKAIAIQRDEPHGFTFGCGLMAATKVQGAPAPNAIARKLMEGGVATSSSEPAELTSRTAVQVAAAEMIKRLNRRERDLELIAKILTPERRVWSNPSMIVPPTMYTYLASGFVKFAFNGIRKRQQQDFTISYFLSGMQRTTTPMTTPVSLYKRPTAVSGELDVWFSGNRRDLRKLDRLRRQQVLVTKGNDSIELLSVALDHFEPHEHTAAVCIQRIWRGFEVRRAVTSLQGCTRSEEGQRRGFVTDEQREWVARASHFFSHAVELHSKVEQYQRTEIWFDEGNQRAFLVEEARRLLQELYYVARARVEREEILASIPILDGVTRLHINAAQVYDFAWIMMEAWFFHGAAWDRFYLELECYQGILQLRNNARDENKLDRLQFGYVIPYPTPPSTNLDSGRSIIRVILEEKDRRARRDMMRKVREKRIAALLAATQPSSGDSSSSDSDGCKA